jgi:hypothetical protein
MLRDLTLTGADACVGLGLANWLFATPGTTWVIALGPSPGCFQIHCGS